MKGSRILVGQFLLEANSFAPGATRLEDFSPAGLYFGEDLARERLPDGSELAAAWDVLLEHGCRVLPSVRAYFGAGPPASAEAWSAIRAAVFKGAEQGVDGVYLALHGAALAEGVDDPEGELLEGVRARVGPTVPIAISLDCHAGWTPRMEGSCDIATAYGTVPHVDLRRTGAEAARLLLSALRGEIRPVTRGSLVPMIAGAIRQDSGTPEFRALLEAARSHEQRDGVLAAAVLPSHPWRDVPELSWGAIATTDGDPALAIEVAEDLAHGLWTHREWLSTSDALPIRVAVAEALRLPAPVALADAGDSPTGGSLGGSTELLRAWLNSGLGEASGEIWLMITDERATREARRNPEGSKICIQIGNGPSGAFDERTAVVAEVGRRLDGAFTYTGPFAAGVTADMGDACVLHAGTIRIVLHSRSVMEIDPSPLLHAGMEPRRASIMQAKSHVSFRAGYAEVARSFLVADTPGPTAMTLSHLPYTRRPRPLYPFEPEAAWSGRDSIRTTSL